MYAFQIEKLDNQLLADFNEEISYRLVHFSVDIMIEILRYLNDSFSLSDWLVTELYSEILKRKPVMTRENMFEFLKLKIGNRKNQWVNISQKIIEAIKHETKTNTFEEKLVLRSAIIQIHEFKNKKLGEDYLSLKNEIESEIEEFEKSSNVPKFSDFDIIELLINALSEKSSFGTYWLSYLENNLDGLFDPADERAIKKKNCVKILSGIVKLFGFESQTLIKGVDLLDFG